MTKVEIIPNTTPDTQVLDLNGFLEHWLGHRRLTRRVIEAFPEDQLFSFSAGTPLRSFGVQAGEIHFVSQMTIDGLSTGVWTEPNWASAPQNKADLLTVWDALTARIENEFGKVNSESFSKNHLLPWGEMTGWVASIYNIDNETHHRAQAYVYLRGVTQKCEAGKACLRRV